MKATPHVSRFAAVFLLALAPLQCWATHKCTLPDGRVQYQDAACPASAKTASVVKTPSDAEQSPQDRWAKSLVEMKKSQDEFDASQAARRDEREAQRLKQKIKHDAFCGELQVADPVPGMTEEQAFECSRMSTWGHWVTRDYVHPVTGEPYRVFFFPNEGRSVRVAKGKVEEVRVVSKGTVR